MRLHSLLLPFRFDPARLKQDLDRVAAPEWVSHYNQSDYEGNWSGVALRSTNGAIDDLVVRALPYRDTPLLARCPYFGEALRTFACPITAARLLRLHPGSLIKEHSDPALGFEDGEVRLHIPIQTSRDVHFSLEGRRMTMQEGDCWYLDLSRPHRIENRGLKDRVHLVIDAVVNEWLRAVFQTAAANGFEPPPRETTEFDRFRDLVFDRPDLQRALASTADRPTFIRTAVDLGREHGFLFDADLVESAIRRGRESWNRRWEDA